MAGIAGRFPSLLMLKQNLIGMLPTFDALFTERGNIVARLLLFLLVVLLVLLCENAIGSLRLTLLQSKWLATPQATEATPRRRRVFPCASCQVCCLNYCNMSIFPLPLLLSCQRQFLALNYVHGTHRKPQSRTIQYLHTHDPRIQLNEKEKRPISQPAQPIDPKRPTYIYVSFKY